MLKTLVDRRVIALRYPVNSPWFDAVVLTPGGSARSGLAIDWPLLRAVAPGVRVTPGTTDRSNELRSVAPGVNQELRSVAPGVKVTPGGSVLGGGGVLNIHSTTTTATVRLAIAGQPLDFLQKTIPGFQSGLLIPHYQDAAALDPVNPGARLRGAIFMLAFKIQSGQKINSVLASLRSFVQRGEILDEFPNFSKKGPSNAKTPKEEVIVPADPAWESHPLDQILRVAEVQARVSPDLSVLLASLRGFYAEKNTLWPQAEKDIEALAREGRLQFKKTGETK